MTYYYNGKVLVVPFGKSMADVLEEKGVIWGQQDRIIDWACSFTCCDEFEKAFGENREEDIDFGTGELLGMSVLIPTEMDSDQGVIDYDWTTFRYCPYCGKPFRAKLEEKVTGRCCAVCKHAKVGTFFDEPTFPDCEVHGAFFSMDYVCDKFEMKEGANDRAEEC